MILASGLEARLIEAEALLNAGDVGWLTILNNLRADSALAPLANPGTADSRIDMLFREHAFWLFAKGHRLGDMRRLVRQYGRSTDAVFAVGSYFRGGAYGSDVNLPVLLSEQNNPNFSRCLDRAP